MKNISGVKAVFVMLLLAGMIVVIAGCDFTEKDYTFEFKVDHYSYAFGGPVTKVEFLNGSHNGAPVLQTEILDLDYGEMSGVFKVSGFTEKDGDDKRIFGVRITREEDNINFAYASAEDKSKIRIVAVMSSVIQFSNGNW